MRKINQEIHDKKIMEEILQQSNICRIGMIDHDRPYVLAFNYGYRDNQIYIHCAPEGKKLECLIANPSVCFEIEQHVEVIENDVACRWATCYRSIVGYGNIEILDDFDQKKKGLEVIMAHHGAPYLIDFESNQIDAVKILKLTIDHLSAKQSSNWDRIHRVKNVEFETERLEFLEITMEDLEAMHHLHSIPEVDEFNTLGIPGSIEETKQLIEPLIEAKWKNPRDTYAWKVNLKKNKDFIGMAGFSLSNDKYKLGEIYYKLDPSYWGNGYATEMAQSLVSMGFEDFKLQKVEAGVATENHRSIRVLEKIGMTREGLRRKILPIRGEWKDNYHYAIVRTDKRDY